MEIQTLIEDYQSGNRTPIETIENVYERVEGDDTNAWISVRDKNDVIAEADSLTSSEFAEKPLYGIPFAVKDNIDYKGLPTTAGCPAYAYEPDQHASVVKTLLDAGALLIGKTNMDQFATGLVGTRSPHGACRNVFNQEYISGGSSSGSAVAVARSHVAFALGTDTAGSGRVPAAFNGLVGLKPTRGMLSTQGVVPACAELDCVSIFTRTVEDAVRVEDTAAQFDPEDPYSRHEANAVKPAKSTTSDIQIGVPEDSGLEFFNDQEARQLFDKAVNDLQSNFGELQRIDFEPFRKAAELLYGGPWVAERFTAVGEFLEENSEDVNPIVSDIITEGKQYSAVDTFEAFHQLAKLRREAESVLKDIDVLAVPTTGTTYTIEQIRSEPFELNSNLGYYTNFVNLLDLSALSVPIGSFTDGPGFGITIIGDSFDDAKVASVSTTIQDGNPLSTKDIEK